ncbi:hypothetical protein GALMADRAFT_259795 [Galerina marginata CBS 339.88]|uniref:Uncharacterized protein n=1 Tax=Galerina marginata (strain CBS 339.88) TaxID=685588 RepID=A0A067S5J4_GALM3|nr:hypothetical protein GALMADRAFT_259795 [Galerina marginata CBS 339.88]
MARMPSVRGIVHQWTEVPRFTKLSIPIFNEAVSRNSYQAYCASFLNSLRIGRRRITGLSS